MSRKIHDSVHGNGDLDRILRSNVFRNSDSLRRLLRYLTERSLAGEGDDLKEFTVGVEALGKPEDYNPQLDPSVRVQVGRLRRKLEEYYETEGQNDQTRITLPKRHFKIVFEERSEASGRPAATDSVVTGRLKFWRGVGLGASLAAILLTVLAFYLAGVSRKAEPAGAGNSLTPEQLAFWSPYLAGSRPSLICVGTPMFLWFEGTTGTFVRDPLVNDWPPETARDKIAELQSALGGAAVHPVQTYTGASAAMAAFLIGKQLTRAGLDPMLVRSSHFNWTATRGANVVYFGAPKDIPHLRDEQFQSEFRVVPNGVENRNPAPGEQKFYGRETLDNGRPTLTHAVIGRFRTKDENGCVTVVSGWDGPGTLAAAEFLTRPESMKELDRLLLDGRDEYPQSFEILIRAECEDEFPVNLTYVAHRIHE